MTDVLNTSLQSEYFKVLDGFLFGFISNLQTIFTQE